MIEPCELRISVMRAFWLPCFALSSLSSFTSSVPFRRTCEFVTHKSLKSTRAESHFSNEGRRRDLVKHGDCSRGNKRAASKRRAVIAICATMQTTRLKPLRHRALTAHLIGDVLLDQAGANRQTTSLQQHAADNARNVPARRKLVHQRLGKRHHIRLNVVRLVRLQSNARTALRRGCCSRRDSQCVQVRIALRRRSAAP